MTDFADDCLSGLYRIDAGQRAAMLRAGALPEGYRAVVIEGSGVESREVFFDKLANALSFPSYFGRNWDAVYDCLTDPSVMPVERVVLVLDGFERFAVSEPEQWRVALNVFGDASEFWTTLDRSLCVLLYGAEGHAPGLALLPSECLRTLPAHEPEPSPGA